MLTRSCPFPSKLRKYSPRQTEKHSAFTIFQRPILIGRKSLNEHHLGWSDSNPTVRTGIVVKCLAMLFMAVIMLAGVRASDAALRIGQDRGGRIGAYVDRYQGLRSSGEMVIIDGSCISACTIVLGSVPHDKICVTSRAKLGFHAAWNPGSNGRKIADAEATQALYSMYPFEVRRWIDQRGGLSPRMIFLSGRKLAAIYRPCYLDSRASSH
jgi:hypothetical protein